MKSKYLEITQIRKRLNTRATLRRHYVVNRRLDRSAAPKAVNEKETRRCALPLKRLATFFTVGTRFNGPTLSLKAKPKFCLTILKGIMKLQDEQAIL